jgi:RimJ/RimL family protein N-acetyltransferase
VDHIRAGFAWAAGSVWSLLQPRERPIRRTLPDGTRVVFRPVRAEDRDLLRDGYARLSERSRYRRFSGFMGDLSEARLTYLTDLDGRNHVAWGAIVGVGTEVAGAGVARYVRLPENHSRAELAVTVVDVYQRIGVAHALLWLLTRSAMRGGVRHFVAFVADDNRPMRSLLQRVGLHVEGRDPEGALILPLPRSRREFDRLPVPALIEESGVRG